MDRHFSLDVAMLKIDWRMELKEPLPPTQLFACYKKAQDSHGSAEQGPEPLGGAHTMSGASAPQPCSPDEQKEPQPFRRHIFHECIPIQVRR
jgi:hypothetical protein